MPHLYRKAQPPRQAERSLGDIREDEQQHEHDKIERYESLERAFHRYLADLAAEEQRGADRGSAETYSKAEHQHDAEVVRVHAEGADSQRRQRSERPYP